MNSQQCAIIQPGVKYSMISAIKNLAELGKREVFFLNPNKAKEHAKCSQTLTRDLTPSSPENIFKDNEGMREYLRHTKIYLPQSC